jgi:DNA repair exonuclease SbcCD ATPase subunit
MEGKVIDQQIEINKIRNEIEVKKGAIKAYQSHIKEKAIRRKNRIALLKKQRLRCPDCDIGFLTEEKLNNHIETIHTEDIEFMRQTAKEYNEKLQEEEYEEREDIKDLVEKTHNKIEALIKTETSDLKMNLIDSKRRREEELTQLQLQYHNESRRREEEKHMANTLLEQNNQRLNETTNGIMVNFETKLKSMFGQITEKLKKDEDEERSKDERARKIEQDLLMKIEKKNEKITQLRSSNQDLEEKFNRRSHKSMTNTFERLDELKNTLNNAPASMRKLQELEQKKNQERELILMEAEELRTRQILLENKSKIIITKLDKKQREEAEKKAEEMKKVKTKPTKADLEEIEHKVKTDLERQKQQEIEQLEKEFQQKEESIEKSMKERMDKRESNFKELSR